VKRWLPNVVLLLFSTALTLGALEVGVRVLGLAPPETMAEPDGELRAVLDFDPVLETRYKPGSSTVVRSPHGEFEIEYAFNELGLRDRPLAGDDRVRVLALGNSFVEGWGLAGDATFLRHVEGALPGVRTVNAGAAGYGAIQSSLLLRELLPAVRPDAVVFVLVGTMVQADHGFLSRAALDAEGIATGLDPDALLAGVGDSAADTAPPGILDALGRWSELARLLATRIRNYRAQQALVHGNPGSDLLAVYREGVDPAALYEPTLRHVAAMRDLAAEDGLPFLVLHLPMPFQLSEAEWTEGRKFYRLAPGLRAPEEREAVAAYCTAVGLDCVFGDTWLAEAMPGPLFYAYDFHLNAAGSRVVGEGLAAALRARLAAGGVADGPSGSQ
jgi:hypothetical protein